MIDLMWASKHLLTQLEKEQDEGHIHMHRSTHTHTQIRNTHTFPCGTHTNIRIACTLTAPHTLSKLINFQSTFDDKSFDKQSELITFIDKHFDANQASL